MRRLIPTLVIAIAALAISAPAAMAISPPNNDNEKDNWVKVEVYDTPTGDRCTAPYWQFGCNISSGASADWDWTGSVFGFDWSDDCVDGGIDLRVAGDGAAVLTYATWDHQWEGNFCAQQRPTYSPGTDWFYWSGATCYHQPTGEFWHLQKFEVEQVSDPTIKSRGYSFGQWTGTDLQGEFVADGLRFGTTTTYAETTMPNGWKHRAEFPFNFDLSLYPSGSDPSGTSTETPCGWGILS